MDQTHRFDIDMDVDRHQTCHDTTFRRDDKQCLRINEIRAVMDHVEQLSHQRIMEQRQEQAKLESLATNGAMARMMATMGYMLAMSLGNTLRHTAAQQPRQIQRRCRPRLWRIGQVWCGM
jgi:hypothetical protein